MNITWEKTENGTRFYADGQYVGTAEAANGAEDCFSPLNGQAVLWTRRTAAPTEETALVFRTAYQPSFTMIPSVSYDGNRCFLRDYTDVRNQNAKGKKEEKRVPTYFLGDRDPETGEPWRMLWHRSAVPGATYSEGTAGGPLLSVGMFLPKGCAGGAMSLYTDGTAVHALLWPEQDSYLKYYEDGPAHVKAPECRDTFAAVLVFAAGDEEKTGYKHLLSAAWQLYDEDKPFARSDAELWDLGVAYAKQLYTEEPDGFCGFSIGFTWEGAWVKRRTQKYEIGWCGQNASFANSLLYNALKTGDAESARMGLAVLDAWIAAAKPHGLIPTHYDDNQYTNGFAKTVDACNLGTASVQFFEAAELAEKLGEPRPAYRKMALRIAAFARDVMDEDGRIGKSWLESDLSPAVRDGSTGAFLTHALAVAAEKTGEAAWLDAAEKSCAYYNKELLTNGYTTAGALDIFTIDKESCIPILKANLKLYHLTGKPEYLSCAEKAAWYLSTWQWHYSREFPAGSLLNKMGFDTFGGTCVSIHGGMDPYALFYVNDLLELAERTGNPEWERRAAGVWHHGQMCISDGDLVIDGKAPRPRGSQDESAAVSISRTGWESTPSQWLVAWPTAFRLEALRHRDVL